MGCGETQHPHIGSFEERCPRLGGPALLVEEQHLPVVQPEQYRVPVGSATRRHQLPEPAPARSGCVGGGPDGHVRGALLLSGEPGSHEAPVVAHLADGGRVMRRRRNVATHDQLRHPCVCRRRRRRVLTHYTCGWLAWFRLLLGVLGWLSAK